MPRGGRSPPAEGHLVPRHRRLARSDNVLAGLYAVDEVLVPWHRGELVVLPAGTSPPDPAHILGSHAMEELLKQLKERFDLVLIDAPPLLPVSDAESSALHLTGSSWLRATGTCDVNSSPRPYSHFAR